MKKSQLRKLIRESIKGLVNEQSNCDNTPQGACAQQWLKPNLANDFLPSSHACTGGNTYYNMGTSQIYQAIVNVAGYNGSTASPAEIAAAANCFSGNSFQGAPQNWQDIETKCKNYSNVAGLTVQQRGKIKRKMMKARWGECMHYACNC